MAMPMSIRQPLLAALLIGASSAQSIYEFGADSPIVKLTDDNFDKEVTADTRHLWVVEYYADWCGHCKEFAKGYAKAASNLQGLVKFGAVNADNAPVIANSAGVQGFPTVRIYLPVAERNPYTGKSFKPSLEYQGPRTARGLVEFVTENIPSDAVTTVTDDTFEEFKRSELPKAVLFTEKSETPTMIKSLSVRLRGRMTFGIGKQSKTTATCATLGVDTFPSLYVFADETKPPLKYEGELKVEALGRFLEAHAAAEADESAAADSSTSIPIVSSENLASLVTESRDPWILILIQQTAEETAAAAELAESVRGQARVGLADEAVLATYAGEDKKTPSVVVLPFGTGAKGASRAHRFDDVASAKKAALESIPDTYVDKLQDRSANDPSLDQFMQVSLGGTETMAMALLFTDKPQVPPIFRSVAMEFEGKIGFATLGQAHMERFNVKKLPTLLVLFPGENTAPTDGQPAGVALQGAVYTPQVHGKFSYPNIASFVANFIRARKHELDNLKGEGEVPQEGERAAPPAPKKELGPLPELSAANFDAECGSKGGLCAIALLDGAADNSNKEAQLEMLSKLRARRHGGPLAFSWLDATCHPEYLAHFDLSETDLPTMLVLHPSKLRWARAVGAFDAETLGAFGTGVASGRARTDELQSLPTLQEVDCATVKRGAEAYVAEEEDSLSEDILAEILEEERLQREEREAAAAAAKGAADEPTSAPRELSEIQKLEAELEDCTAMDLLCAARNEKTQKKIDKRVELEAKLKEIAKKKKKKKKRKAQKAEL